jgi:uncharacterized membrane protein
MQGVIARKARKCIIIVVICFVAYLKLPHQVQVYLMSDHSGQQIVILTTNWWWQKLGKDWQ